MEGNSYIFSNSQIVGLKFVYPDTAGVDLDLGLGVIKRFYARLARMKAIKSKEKEALTYINDSISSSKKIKIAVYPITKTNNYLVDIFLDGTNLNNVLLEKGYVTRYKRGK